MILHRTGKNLRRTGRAPVDENHHGDVGGNTTSSNRIVLALAGRVLLLKCIAVLHKLADDIDGLFQQSTRVVPHIHNHGRGPGCFCLTDSCPQFIRCIGAKLAEAYQGYLGARQHSPSGGRGVDLAAGDRNLQALALLGAQHSEFDLRAGFAANVLYDVIERPRSDVLIVHFNDDVTRFYARFLGRRTVKGRDDHG